MLLTESPPNLLDTFQLDMDCPRVNRLIQGLLEFPGPDKRGH